MVDIPNMVKYGNVMFEGFTPPQLIRARYAWDAAKRSAQKALDSIRNFDKPNEIIRITRWFGLTPKRDPRHAQLLMSVQSKITAINDAFQNNRITLAYRPSIQVKHVPVNPNDPLVPVMLPGNVPFTGANVYGYVHHHVAGSGYRVILGKWFMNDPTPNEDAQTIYHELSHKIAKTKDHCYGVANCENLARTDPARACDNADNFGYFAKSLIGA